MTISKYLKKLLNEQFKDISDKRWYETIALWLISSKYRKYMQMDKFLKKQITNPDERLVTIASTLRKDNPYKTVSRIEEFVIRNFHYVNDVGEEWSDAIDVYLSKRDDCLIWNTKLLTSSFELINIEDIKIGDKIIGKDGKPVKITNKWDKGFLPTKKIILNNGSEMIATDEHKFLLRDGKEILCSNLKVGDLLKELPKIELNDEAPIDKDYWYLK